MVFVEHEAGGQRKGGWAAVPVFAKLVGGGGEGGGHFEFFWRIPDSGKTGPMPGTSKLGGVGGGWGILAAGVLYGCKFFRSGSFNNEGIRREGQRVENEGFQFNAISFGVIQEFFDKFTY